MYHRILVTGGTGLVGYAFEPLRDEYPGVEFVSIGSKVCDLTKLDKVVDYVNSINPDAIIHLAALSGGIQFSSKYPATLLRDNVLMNLNIMEAARLCKVKKTIMTLSTG
ncbi:MAG: NAD-dependent epimerase/dehydratase family protein, partial [Candidatus Omnitrophica bacterium]|nr:NAD-dependent epimerase/dehydratase family protein [Candidatus Omnitrophota bacterium]